MVIQANPAENDGMAMTMLELMNMMSMLMNMMQIKTTTMLMNMMPIKMMLMKMMPMKIMLMKMMLICQQIMMQNFADLHRIDPGGSESVSGPTPILIPAVLLPSTIYITIIASSTPVEPF